MTAYPDWSVAQVKGLLLPATACYCLTLPDWSVAQVKDALWKGGIVRSNKAEGKRSTPGLTCAEDLVGAHGMTNGPTCTQAGPGGRVTTARAWGW